MALRDNGIMRGASRGFGNLRGSVFSPLDLTNLKLWLDAADSTTITETAGAVSQWDDKSGNGNHATQGVGASQPLTGGDVVNSLNVISLDGIDDFMILPPTMYGIPEGDNTVIILYALDRLTGAQRVFNGTTAGTRWALLNNATTNQGLNNSGFVPANITFVPDFNPHINWLKRTGATVDTGFDTLGGVCGCE